MNNLKLLHSRDEIRSRVAELAAEIRGDYQGKNPLLLGVLKGSFVFMADLVRELEMPVEVEFIRLSSYRNSTQTSGKIRVVQGIRRPIEGRHVLVVEDIVDTGLTVKFLFEYLHKRKPLSLKLCTLFNKPSRRVSEVTIDYLGFTIPDAFVVGYGLDWDEKFRYLPDLCTLEES